MHEMHFRNERFKRQTRRHVASRNMINATFCATINKKKNMQMNCNFYTFSREADSVECEGKRQRILNTRVIRDECVEMRLRVWLNNSSSATGV